jgi:Cof subfamily protein (haloacid dehalogenase superfamily)
MIKMIVLDLDLTLLHSKRYISPRNLSALQRCRDKGIVIAYATARSANAAARFTEAFTPDVFIGYGGSLALAGDEVVCRFDIPADVSTQLIRDCLAEPEITTILAINEVSALMNAPAPFESDHSHYKIVDFTGLEPSRYLKISVFADAPSAVERIAARYPTLDTLRYSGENLYRFASRDARKWNATQAVAAHYGVPVAEIAAFGDDVIDREIIKNCGVGVAMGNAVDSVKAAADFICDTNDNDGVAKWLEERLLAEA